MNELLDSLGVPYENEKAYKYYAVDNYLPQDNLIIEVMGDYWHGNPIKYQAQLSDRQRRVTYKDRAKCTYIRNTQHINILYIWEHDLLTRIDVCAALVTQYIDSGGVLSDYHSFNYRLDNNFLKLNEKCVTAWQDRPAV